MTKTPGFHVTVKAFIPSSRTNFAAQAKAATVMDELTKGRVITPSFVELATILDVSGKFGSVKLPELPDVDLSGLNGSEEQAGEDSQPDEQPPAPETPPAARQRRSASQG